MNKVSFKIIKLALNTKADLSKIIFEKRRNMEINMKYEYINSDDNSTNVHILQ